MYFRAVLRANQLIKLDRLEKMKTRPVMVIVCQKQAWRSPLMQRLFYSPLAAVYLICRYSGTSFRAARLAQTKAGIASLSKSCFKGKTQVEQLLLDHHHESGPAACLWFFRCKCFAQHPALGRLRQELIMLLLGHYG